MKSSHKISASLMCADLGHLEREIKKLERAGIDYLHIDIMDGHFVPNFTFGPDLVKKVKQLSKLPLDLHLMVNRPEQFLDIWGAGKGDLITFHRETTCHPQRILTRIKALKAKAGIVLNPATPLNSISYILPDIEVVLLMTVNPGFAGQKWIPSIATKVKRLRQIIQKNGLKTEIEVDGNIGFHNLALLKKAGAQIFVGGSSSIFLSPQYSQNVKRMQRILNQAV